MDSIKYKKKGERDVSRIDGGTFLGARKEVLGVNNWSSCLIYLLNIKKLSDFSRK